MKSIYSYLNTANSKLQHIINTSTIFNYIFDNNLTTRTEMSKSLGISAPAVSSVIEKLIKKDMLLRQRGLKQKWAKDPPHL